MPLSAVELDPGGTGQVLMVPLWTTTGGHASLFDLQPAREDTHDSIEGDFPVLARLRLIAADGKVVFSGNIYLRNAHDSWTAGIGARDGGGGRMVSIDETCLLVDHDGGVAPFAGTIDLDIDHGWAEAIVKGAAADEALQETIAATDCAALAARWNVGEWSTAPTDGIVTTASQIHGTWSLVQVDRGALYNIPGAALKGYSDQVQHTAPGSELPNLASGHDGGTDDDQTISRLCYDGR